MPFTPSHAVVALGFVRTPLVPAAVAIGAMTPDLPLFTRGMALSYSFTHAPQNLLWTTLIAFALFLLWRGVLRPVAPALAPEWVRRRLPGDWRMPASASVRGALGAGAGRAYPVLLALSLAIGVVTHIVWDAFTHEGRWGVNAIAALGEMWGPLPGYKWLQHGSSLLALAIIGIWAVVWMLRRRPVPAGPRGIPGWVAAAWAVSLPALLAAATAWTLAQRGPLDEVFTLQHLMYAALPPACGIWGAITLLLCGAVVVLRGGADAASASEIAEKSS